MNRFTITVYPEGKKIIASEGDVLLRVLKKAGFPIPASCGGQGTCGKCRVVVRGGVCHASPSPFLRKEEIGKGYCLACLVLVEGDMEVEIPPESRAAAGGPAVVVGHKAGGDKPDTAPGAPSAPESTPSPAPGVPAAGSRILFEEKPVVRDKLVLGKWEIEPRTRRVHLQMQPPSLDDHRSDIERLRADLVVRGFSGERMRCPLPVLKKLSKVLRSGSWQITVTLIELPDGVEILDIQPGDQTQHHLGLAIDVGTTSVVVYLVDLLTGQVIDTAGSYNAQIRCGEDVISRIVYARTHEGLAELQQLVVGTMNELIDQILQGTGLAARNIGCIVAAGNTTMIHLLLGLDPRYIREEPYIPTVSSVPPVKAAEIGLKVNEHAYLYCLPAIASFVGGDITAGILTTGMHKEPPLTIFIDIGTNGEIVLGNADWLVTASCSAGPAFEGGEVLHGMRAASGAIESVAIDRETLEPRISVIGQAAPAGICGSGIIDALAEMLLTGLLDRKGKICRDIAHPRLREGEYGFEYVLVFAKDSAIQKDIVITEIDINNILRAKGAVYAGCSTLLKQMSLGVEDIERFLIAGGFGRYLNIHNAVVIGLLPDIPYEKFRYLGNSSVTGGHLALLSQRLWKEAEHIARSTTYLELSTSASFMDEYVSALFLPHTNISLFPRVELLLGERK
ncbi:MAG: ASKHA domain-containing protein [bacterium]